MNKRLLISSAFLAVVAFTLIGLAADLRQVPAEPIAKKKELLFSDDFERAELGKAWGQVVPTFTLENGAMKGTQTRQTTPAQDGKPAVTGHQAVVGSDVPTKDSIVEFRFRFNGASAVSAEFDDRKYTGAHYGHICFVRVTPKSVNLTDQKDGSMRNDIYAMTDPSQRTEKAKLLVGRSATFPVQLEENKWYTMVLETVGDSMRASIDGKPVAFLKSSGIAHPTKSKIEFGCGGTSADKAGYFDDVKIWNAEAAK
ncbi:MAG TPA: hypothetical protein VH370_13130 [Humisphaera sp.]|jgi:hypothetical protein|nr:hypothetical protein [Humisphaera sp.]